MKGPRLLDLRLAGRVSGLLGPQEEKLGPEHFGAICLSSWEGPGGRVSEEQGAGASPMRSDDSTWQLGLAKATISSSSSSAGIFLPSSWGRSCRGPHSPPAERPPSPKGDGRCGGAATVRKAARWGGKHSPPRHHWGGIYSSERLSLLGTPSSYSPELWKMERSEVTDRTGITRNFK
jgi:hypothetical protein